VTDCEREQLKIIKRDEVFNRTVLFPVKRHHQYREKFINEKTAERSLRRSPNP
jgi:hypothetical protein